MNFNPNQHHRRSIRLQGYDYSQAGYYFITICVKNRINYFGKIIDGKMYLSDIGKIVEQCWYEIPKHFPHVALDEHLTMPNHLHGNIVIIDDNVNAEAQNVGAQNVGAQNLEPLRMVNKFQHIIPKSLGSIVRGFKIGVTKWCRNNNHSDFMWQRNFYEHIIRNEKSLNNIRQYIINNPFRWQNDLENLKYLPFLNEKNRTTKIQDHYNKLFI